LTESWLDEMGLRTLLLYVTVAGVICCECAILSHEARPVVETDLQLTAADTDSGNWTANLGDIEVRQQEDGLQNNISELISVRILQISVGCRS
jgi:hypothetical protein